MASEAETTYTAADGKRRPLEFQNCTVKPSAKATQIIIPESMTPEEAIVWLTRFIKHQDEVISPNIQIPCYPFDGLVAFHRAINRVFGFVSLTSTPSFFGEEPPTMMHIPTGLTETVEVPIGRMNIQGIHGYIEVMPGQANGKPALVISGQVRRKGYEMVRKLADETKAELAANSIYKSKAIILGRRKDEQPPQDRRRNELPGGLSHPPQFMPASGLTPETLVLADYIQAQVESFLWTPIEKSDACRQNGVPLKRGILLAGGYGTGKSMTAAITADKAVANGWTFIHLANNQMLPLAIDIAKWYQPAVIFAEDIDAVMGTQERNEAVNTMLNCVDGIEKNYEILVVLTTNNLDKINRGFLRPGRLDAVIEFELPNADAAGRLIRQYGCGLVPAAVNVAEAAEIIKGAPASMVREVVERAKLSAIARTDCASELGSEDLANAARSLRSHLRHMTEPKDRLDANLRTVGKAMVEMTATLGERLQDGNGELVEEEIEQ